MSQRVPTAQRPRVLLVDDERDLVETLTFRLEASGYETIAVLDGAAALAHAQHDAPDLIILDLMLPKMHGYEVCRALKRDRRYARIPIIVLSAKILDSDERRSRECGADAYIRKPFQARELLETMRALLAPTGRARGGA